MTRSKKSLLAGAVAFVIVTFLAFITPHTLLLSIEAGITVGVLTAWGVFICD